MRAIAKATHPEIAFLHQSANIFIAMDMSFSAPVHQDAHLLIDIVDEAWAADTLPVEDIEVPPTAITNIDEDDPTAHQEDGDENKWTDLALDELSNAAPPPAAASSASRTPVEDSNNRSASQR